MITVHSNTIRQPLAGEKLMFWVDVETTGLNPQDDIILEVGLRVTNSNLLELARWTSLVTSVLPNTISALKGAHPIVQDMHRNSGLMSAIQQLCSSEIAHDFWPEKVEMNALNWLIDFLGPDLLAPGGIGPQPMCGSSVHFDREFLRIHMPALFGFFSHRNIDVSTIKELCKTFNPRVAGYLADEQALMEKTHRPQEDLDATIAELKFYMTEFLLIDDSINLDDSHEPAQLPLFE